MSAAQGAYHGFAVSLFVNGVLLNVHNLHAAVVLVCQVWAARHSIGRDVFRQIPAFTLAAPQGGGAYGGTGAQIGPAVFAIQAGFGIIP